MAIYLFYPAHFFWQDDIFPLGIYNLGDILFHKRHCSILEDMALLHMQHSLSLLFPLILRMRRLNLLVSRMLFKKIPQLSTLVFLFHLFNLFLLAFSLSLLLLFILGLQIFSRIASIHAIPIAIALLFSF